MRNKILFVSTIARTSMFNRPFMCWFRECGWRVDYASAGEEKIMDCDNQYVIPMVRNPLSLKNVQALKSLRVLIEKENYNIVHCHTPVASVVTRLAARKLRKNGLKILYTSHGFHFYTGAPLFNWIVYYPVEKCLARFTDGIITINNEDFSRAQKNFCRCKAIYKIDGIGVSLQRFYSSNINRKLILRKKYGYKDNDFILIYVAELNKNKNHIFLLKQVKAILKTVVNMKILFIGSNDYPPIKKYIEWHNLESIVYCLGYKDDVENYYALSDICFSSSIREGLPCNIIEGMATGLPLICSKNRGHNALMTHNRNGLLFGLDKPNEMVDAIIKLYNDAVFYERISKNNVIDAVKYSLDVALRNMEHIYRQFM
jgi:glycosyltransferase EpsD